MLFSRRKKPDPLGTLLPELDRLAKDNPTAGFMARRIRAEGQLAIDAILAETARVVLPAPVWTKADPIVHAFMAYQQPTDRLDLSTLRKFATKKATK